MRTPGIIRIEPHLLHNPCSLRIAQRVRDTIRKPRMVRLNIDGLSLRLSPSLMPRVERCTVSIASNSISTTSIACLIF